MTKRAIVFLADGFEETEALAPVDLMRRCGVEVSLVSINADRNVCSSHNIHIVADQTIAEPLGNYDLVFLPGGMPGTTNLNACQAVRDTLTKANADGKWIAAICAAPMVLGQMGLLNGREATCFPGFEEHLHGATHLTQSVVADGNIITAIGAGASLNLGVELVAALIDRSTADKIASQIQMGK